MKDVSGGVHWYRLKSGNLVAFEEYDGKVQCATCLHPATLVGTIIGRNPAFYCERGAQSKIREWEATDIGFRPYGSEVPE